MDARTRRNRIVRVVYAATVLLACCVAGPCAGWAHLGDVLTLA